MAKTKRSHHKADRRSPAVPRGGLSPGEFCAKYSVSRSTLESWRRKGLAPREVQPIKGGRILITSEAEAEWLQKHTALAAVAEATG
jgi:hypothetical protein